MARVIRIELIAVVFLALVFFVFFIVFNNSPPVDGLDFEKQLMLKINNATLNIEFARTDAERQKGLSGRESLASESGLLFIFELPGRYGFWMKDMKFPIDIIWIDENKKIADITANFLPLSFPQTFLPASPIKYVLEVNAFWAEKNNIKIGDTASF